MRERLEVTPWRSRSRRKLASFKAEQTTAFQATLDAYRRGCNWVSQIVYDTQNHLHQASLHDRNDYHRLRTEYGLRSQMAQSVVKTVLACYRSLRTNGYPWTRSGFQKLALDLVRHRGYALRRCHTVCARGFDGDLARDVMRPPGAALHPCVVSLLSTPPDGDRG